MSHRPHSGDPRDQNINSKLLFVLFTMKVKNNGRWAFWLLSKNESLVPNCTSSYCVLYCLILMGKEKPVSLKYVLLPVNTHLFCVTKQDMCIMHTEARWLSWEMLLHDRVVSWTVVSFHEAPFSLERIIGMLWIFRHGGFSRSFYKETNGSTYSLKQTWVSREN